ncbi:lasso peptide biosynthesis PqqD family chaperone [Streptomyces sp. SID3343]|uniref:lasso peptide biosynthesis PqqD family chaperone n=1 Tax=Streptomyces sp. SID3343 TaxID=2690260 RepID=UPI001369CE77|nr:lasso peptide biosynthesis PqqD family chaperone [Streptomyces sp. SID3343]MYV98276.1 lasso peptide biosynthesis PqqD family chaperone [Streptomyces sp. SID3343]
MTDTTPTLGPTVHATATDTGTVLLDERTGRYWQLNPTGAHILQALLDGTTTADIAHALAERHPGLTPEQAERDVTALVDHLHTAKLVMP